MALAFDTVILFRRGTVALDDLAACFPRAKARRLGEILHVEEDGVFFDVMIEERPERLASMRSRVLRAPGGSAVAEAIAACEAMIVVMRDPSFAPTPLALDLINVHDLVGGLVYDVRLDSIGAVQFS